MDEEYDCIVLGTGLKVIAKVATQQMRMKAVLRNTRSGFTPSHSLDSEL